MDALQAMLGEEIQDAYEETFDLFSRAAALPNLGMVDATATELDLSIAGKDFTVRQSPGLLQSRQKLGTTGAAVWQTSVRLAEWLALPDNALWKHGVLAGSSTVLELGAGTSGILAAVLASKVHRVVATDQQHVLKLLRINLDANAPTPLKAPRRKVQTAGREAQANGSVSTLALDWELDDVTKQLRSNGLGAGVDLVLACDCIFNYALIEPFVQACHDACDIGRRDNEGRVEDGPQTLCLVAQQLRQSEVFEQWLAAHLALFRVWRVPSELLNEGLNEGNGFALHIGILR
ncbi:Ribosomal protein lysine methyltransferase [Teratosphaeriaceae sp. CCFEE 6253]|nr:Ribosomal protein lysine methyltransferase [Teratosphaeriaceae sp. CCFEE 6253]